MKTPNDLTQEQKEMLGFYIKRENNWQSVAVDNMPLFVNARLSVPLHESGIQFDFTIWQDCGLVGGNRIDVPIDLLVYVFDFTWDLAHLERHHDNTEMIDALLLVLEKIQEKLAQ